MEISGGKVAKLLGFTTLLVVSIAAALLLAGKPDLTKTATQPNIIVIIFDDMGYGDLGAYGNSTIQTPNVDALANKGLRFDNAFLTTSSCTASRASLLTGRYPHNSGAPGLHDEIPGDKLLFTSLLRDAGYYTASVGKWHIGPHVRDQFDLVIGGGGESGARNWVSSLRGRPEDKPFFFWFSSLDPHVPYQTIAETALYDPDMIQVPPYLYDGPGAREVISQYYAEITRTDRFIGEVIEELIAQDVLDNTIIFVLSDNGAPFPRAKTTLYDSGIKTPLIVSGAVQSRGTVAELVSMIGLAPTILDVAGIEAPDTMEGSSFYNLLVGKPGPSLKAVYAEQNDHGYPISKRAVRDQQYLYIRNLQQNGTHCLLEAKGITQELLEQRKANTLSDQQARCFSRKRPAEELYDIASDPHSMHDLAREKDMQDILVRMRGMWQDWAKMSGDTASLTD